MVAPFGMLPDAHESAADAAARVRAGALGEHPDDIIVRLSANTSGLTAVTAAELAGDIARGSCAVELRLDLGGVSDPSNVLAALLPALPRVRRMVIARTEGVAQYVRRDLLVGLQTRVLTSLVVLAADLGLDGFEQLFLSMQHMPMLGSLTVCGNMTEDQALMIAGAVRGHRALREVVVCGASEAFGVHVITQACAMSPNAPDRLVGLVKCGAAATEAVPLAMFGKCVARNGVVVRLEDLNAARRPPLVNTGIGAICMRDCLVEDTTLAMVGLALSRDPLLHTVHISCQHTCFTAEGVERLSSGAAASTAMHTLTLEGAIGGAGVVAVALAVTQNPAIQATLVDTTREGEVAMHEFVDKGVVALKGGLLLNGVRYS